MKLLLAETLPISLSLAHGCVNFVRASDVSFLPLALPSGTHLGPYEIVSPLGAGGMGEVYRARDTRLSRVVALKILTGEVTRDSARFRRFQTEAQSSAALSHPNIVSVYDVGEEGGTPYIVSELVEGTTLAGALGPGPFPTKRVLDLAVGIAEGLAAAHAQGIVHRDLKPSNILLTAGGVPKIADFGLAKYFRPSSDPEGSHLTTLPDERTSEGTILGTVGYMSPEQAKGEPADFRSDQFSFGAMLYEMVTGKRAFQRSSSVQTLAAIVQAEPEPIASQDSRVPAPMRWIVERCLAKDPRSRYASTEDLARDLAILREHISELREGESALPSAPRRRSRRLLAWVAVIATVLFCGLAAGFFARGRARVASEPRPLMRLNLTFPAAESPVMVPNPILALSPDGTRLVYAGRSAEGSQLYVRPLDQFAATPIAGTDGAEAPFFSPDGQWVGFWADRKLKKVSLAGGRPVTLCEATLFRGGSWCPDGTILFNPYGQAGLWRVSDNGGAAKPFTTLNPQKGELTHRWPEVLPGGKAAIFTIHGMTGNYDNARIGLVMLETGERRTLLEGGTDARYSPTGHLLYLRAGSIVAVPFDLERLAVTGPPVPVLDGVGVYEFAGFANYAFSPAGNLVYFPRDPRQFEKELVWVDRKGAVRPLTEIRRAYRQVRLSPDGRRAAVATGGEPDNDIWLYDLARNSWDRLTSGGLNNSPVWSSDGQHLAFASSRNGSLNPFWMPIDRSQPAEQLVKANEWMFPTSLSPDGHTMILVTWDPVTGQDISILSLDGDRKLRPVVQTPAAESEARFSPDGHWIAYSSNESGRSEVYVIAYPGPGGRSPISTGGGQNPRWSRDGRELFYLSHENLMVATVETRPQFRAGPPKSLFEVGNVNDYDVAPDGQRFIMIRTPVHASAPASLSVVLGWFDEVKRRVAAGKKLP
jgi:Tol biopolymer transport system component